jgi:hypothetical protein
LNCGPAPGSFSIKELVDFANGVMNLHEMCQNIAMPGQANRASGRIIIVLSFTALLAVLSGYTHPLLPDEGTAAHIFQLSIATLVPVGLLFLFTADWKQPGRSVRTLAFSGAALVFAFAALYYLEHHR